MSRKRVAGLGAALLLAATTTALFASFVQCGGLIEIPPPDDDAGDGRHRDASMIPRDSGGALDSGGADACGVTSDWPGFRRVTELDPCIMNDVLVDPDAGFSLAWEDCPDGGMPGCKSAPLLETVPGWNPPYATARVDAYATHDDAGSGSIMMVVQLDMEAGGTSKFQWDVFDIKTQAPLAEWRQQEGPDSTYFAVPHAVEGIDRGVAYIASVPARGSVAAFGPAASLGTSNPMVKTWTPFPQAGLDAHVSAAWTLFSDSPSRFCINATGQCGLYNNYLPGGSTEFGWHDLMFGYGPVNGWLAEVVLSLSAPAIVLRAVADTHVWGFRTDGIDMVWNESVGDPNIINNQTNTDVWTAPYTVSPATLAATARKVATLGPGRMGWYAIYFNGMYGFGLGDRVIAVDIATGKSQVVSVMSGYSAKLAYIDHSAAWAVMTTVFGERNLFVSIALTPQ